MEGGRTELFASLATRHARGVLLQAGKAVSSASQASLSRARPVTGIVALIFTSKPLIIPVRLAILFAGVAQARRRTSAPTVEMEST